MGAMVLQSFIFLVCLLFCSGTSVRVSYDGRSLSSFPADSLQFLKQNNASHIQIFDGNHGLLSALCGNGINVDLYISRENILTVSKSRGLAVAWVQREVASYIGCINITGIVVNSEVMKENHLPLLLPTLKVIDSALVSLNLDQSIKLTASFSLSFVEDCFRIPQKPSSEKFRATLVQVMDFLHRPKSCLTISASCNEKLGLGDCLIDFATRALSVLPDSKLPFQINIRSSPFSGPIDSVELDNRLMSVVRDKNWVGNRLLSFFIEKPWINEFERKEQEREAEQLFPSSRKELIDSDLESIGSKSQLDVVTPLATVPVINPTTPTTPPLVNPYESPASPTTPTTPTTPPLVNPYESPASPTTPTTPTTPPGVNPFDSPASPMTPTTMTPITTPTTTPTTSSGQWCVSSQSAAQTALQVALDYACGYGGADCSAIQKGGSCFNPDTLHDHASYAFNNYYQKNPVPTSCNFGGTAVLTSTDPSASTCQYSLSSTSTSPSVINTTNPSGPTVFGTEPSVTSAASTVLLCFPLFITLTCLIMAAIQI